MEQPKIPLINPSTTMLMGMKRNIANYFDAALQAFETADQTTVSDSISSIIEVLDQLEAPLGKLKEDNPKQFEMYCTPLANYLVMELIGVQNMFPGFEVLTSKGRPAEEILAKGKEIVTATIDRLDEIWNPANLIDRSSET